jgi:SAM-dependent methyltransferase
MQDVLAEKPIDIPTRETTRFLLSYVPPGATILEVGCGDGEVAFELATKGYRVTGLDSELERIAKASLLGVNAKVAAWPKFNHELVDAIAFTRSLHHIDPLDKAVEKARELLKPGGLLLIEDFAFGETDERTVRWFLDILRSDQSKLHVVPVEEAFVTKLLSAEDPVKAWHDNHNPALHPIAAITAAVLEHFEILQSGSVPYLYRYLVPVLPETKAAATFVAQIFDEESCAAQDEIMLMGRRVVARPRRVGEQRC